MSKTGSHAPPLEAGTLHSPVREIEKEKFLIVSRFGEKGILVILQTKNCLEYSPRGYIRNIRLRFLLFYGDFEEKPI